MTSSSQPSNGKRRIVATGVGIVAPVGRTAAEVWSRWEQAERQFAPVRRLDTTNLPAKIAAEVPEFEPKQELKSGRLVRLLRPGEDFGYVAARHAFEDAGLASDQLDQDRSGIAIGCRKEGPKVENLFAAIKSALRSDGTMDRERFIHDGIKLIPPQTIVEGLPNAGMYYIAHEYCLRGVNYNLLSMGSGGTMALGESFRAIRRGEVDLMLAGGYDSWVNWVYLKQLSHRGLLSPSNDPTTAHRPYDKDRDGSVAGEGAGLLILEERDAALARGARIYGELIGYASATGVPHGDLDPCVEALATCITRALRDGGLSPADLDFVHLTGDATPSGDLVEANAVRRALGEATDRTPVTTAKSLTGHLGNASGSVELAVMLESMRRGILLPIVNLTRPDPDLGLQFVREPRPATLQTGLLLSRGWPTHYTALVVRGDTT